MRDFIKIAIATFLVISIMVVSCGVGFLTASITKSIVPLERLVISMTNQYIPQDTPDEDEEKYFEVFWEAWHIIEHDFYGELPNAQEMTYSAIRGVLNTLNDPHTAFVEPRPRQREREDLRGSFGGIGAQVRVRPEDKAIFLIPLPNSPSTRAGIQEGDVLLKVDEVEITPGTTLDDVLSLIRGPVGEPVTLTVSREGVEKPLVFTIIREKIETPTVSWKMLEENIGYVSISLFGERTLEELKDALRELKEQGATRLVFDLRNNPGGLLDTAVDVASQFLEKGTVLYEQRKNAPEKSYSVKSGGLAREMPLAVLVNKATASASEIVAGAIQDYERGVLIGEKTFGKGSVQLVYDLSDGSSIHVTVAHWLTPNRHQISDNGLTPDFEVPLSPEEQAKGKDPQLDKALAYLKALEPGK